MQNVGYSLIEGIEIKIIFFSLLVFSAHLIFIVNLGDRKCNYFNLGLSLTKFCADERMKTLNVNNTFLKIVDLSKLLTKEAISLQRISMVGEVLYSKLTQRPNCKCLVPQLYFESILSSPRRCGFIG